MDKIIDHMEQLVVKFVYKAIGDTFDKIRKQSRPKSYQGKYLETKPNYDFQRIEENSDKKHEIDVLNIKVNDMAMSISPSNSHVNKDGDDLDQYCDESQVSVANNNNDQCNDKGWIPQCEKKIMFEKSDILDSNSTLTILSPQKKINGDNYKIN